MTRSELVDNVKVKMDESTPDGVSHSFDEYIEPMLDESAKDICDTAPLHLLVPKALPIEVDTNLFYEDELAHIQIPSNFSRIYEIKFAGWSKPVRTIIDQNTPEYEHQNDTYLKSGLGRPSVHIKHKVVGSNDLNKYLVCGKVYNLDSVAALYVPYVNAEDLPEQIHEAVAWLTLSKLLAIVGETDASLVAEMSFVKNFTGK